MVGKLFDVTPCSLWLFGLSAEGGQPCPLSTTWEDLAEPCCREVPPCCQFVALLDLAPFPRTEYPSSPSFGRQSSIGGSLLVPARR